MEVGLDSLLLIMTASCDVCLSTKGGMVFLAGEGEEESETKERGLLFM